MSNRRNSARAWGAARRGVLCVFLWLIRSTPAQLWAQAAVAPLEPAETLELSQPLAMETPTGWDYLKPVGNLLALNLVYWAGSRYILNNDYSYIGPQTIANNFAQGFVWDFDEFGVNQFGHPYQGAGYQTGARAVGFGFWGAIAYTVLGSLQWELFMENTPASYNDLVTTSVGGVVLGEVLFRLSSAFLDPSSSGFERVAREGGSLVISPIYEIARLVSGDAARLGEMEGTQPVSIKFGLGFNDFNSSDVRGSIRNVGLDVGLIYGDFVDDGRPFAPFDWFTLRGGVNYRPSDFQAADFDISGLLARWGFGCGSGNDCVWGPAMHYDYHQTPAFEVGTSSAGILALGRFDLGLGGLKLYAGLDLEVIALGGFDSPYVESATGRAYNMGSGGFGRAALVLDRPGWFQLRGYSSRYYVRTVKGVTSHEWAGISGAKLEVPIHWGLGISVGLVLYDRLGVSEEYPRVESWNVAQELRLYWKL